MCKGNLLLSKESGKKERKKENTAWLIHSHFSLALFPLIYKTHFLEFSCCLSYDMCQLWKKNTLNSPTTIHLPKPSVEEMMQILNVVSALNRQDPLTI